MTTTDRPSPPFAVGDIVLLKSGGPAMTVSVMSAWPPSDWRVETVWFNDRTLCRDVFTEKELVKP
jgi:uncharacterized protein YodC (DUF2158 family)